MNRRNFLKNSIYASAGLASSLCITGCDYEKSTTITVLHTNDVHSHITPFDNNHSEYPNQGGFSRRSALIEEVRKNNPNTLLFDAGDVFQGTPYFNLFEGELEFKLMSMLKYDAMTIGNHDFDNGISGLKKQIYWYCLHNERGAELLEEAGSASVAVAWARYHHDREDHENIPAGVIALLRKADRI